MLKFRGKSVLRTLLGSCLACAFLTFSGVGQAQEHMHVVGRSSEMKIGEVRVSQGTSETIKVDLPFSDIVVGDPDIADVVPLTDKSLYVLGKKLGRTSVSVYGKDKDLMGVLSVETSYDTGALAQELHRQLPQNHIDVSSVNGRILLSGTVPDAVTLDHAVQIAKQYGAEVVPSLSVTNSQQVLLEVRFLEVSRTAGRELSSKLDVIGPGWSAHTGFASLPSGNTAFGTVGGTLSSGATSVDLEIQALEDKGQARRLAEPNLIALSGDTASFLAGGEFPFPVQTGTTGQVAIEFKNFGVGLAFTPTVLKDGLINLKIQPEVSELDPTAQVSVGGVTVPSLIVRRASTTLELKDGQSFAMAGLLQNENTTAAAQFPWLGNIPVLGALFRSASFQRKETDLVIIVTPRLVRPVLPGQVLRSPLDTSRRGNDAEYFLNGQADVPKNPGAAGVAPALEDGGGHILSLPTGGIHAQAH